MEDTKEKIRIPVIYVDRPRHTGTLPRGKSPTVEVVIGFDPDLNMDDRHPPKGKFRKFVRARALVDTGADEIFLDEKLVSRTGCPVIEGPAMTVKSPHGEKIHDRHRAQIIFPYVGLKAEVEVFSAEIQDGTRAYDAIFGTSFLELGCLVVDPRGDSHFTFHSNSTR
jgi:predicted aspartyl protease